MRPDDMKTRDAATRAEKTDRLRRRNRAIILGVVAVALVAMAAPSLMRRVMERDLCPNTETGRGEEGGVSWSVIRADCGGGRLVWQLRIVPAKGVSTVAYEAEGGPAPAGWRQKGFDGEVLLAEPLASGETRLPLTIDLKGRPVKPIRVAAGRRVD